MSKLPLDCIEPKTLCEIIKMVEDNTISRLSARQLIDAYIKAYMQCINKVTVANSIGKTDLLYSVATHVKDVPSYKPEDFGAR